MKDDIRVASAMGWRAAAGRGMPWHEREMFTVGEIKCVYTIGREGVPLIHLPGGMYGSPEHLRSMGYRVTPPLVMRGV